MTKNQKILLALTASLAILTLGMWAGRTAPINRLVTNWHEMLAPKPVIVVNDIKN